MKTEIVTMTPEWAESILSQQNNHNRQMRLVSVHKIASAIRHGDWKITHQGIAIDANGQLLDGQHRLAAIVLAQQSVELMLSTDCDPSLFDVVDCGVARTASDALHLINCSHSAKTASGIKHFFLYQRHPDKVWSGVPVPPHTAIVHFYKNNRELLDEFARYSHKAYQRFRKINQTGLITFCLLAHNAGWQLDIIENFCELFSSGAMLQYDSPILAYRRYLDNYNMPKNKRDNLQQHSLACIIKCFNYWIENVSLKQFKPPAMSPMPSVQAP